MRFNSSSEFPKKLDTFLKFNTECLRFLLQNLIDNIDRSYSSNNKDN